MVAPGELLQIAMEANAPKVPNTLSRTNMLDMLPRCWSTQIWLRWQSIRSAGSRENKAFVNEGLCYEWAGG